MEGYISCGDMECACTTARGTTHGATYNISQGKPLNPDKHVTHARPGLGGSQGKPIASTQPSFCMCHMLVRV